MSHAAASSLPAPPDLQVLHVLPGRCVFAHLGNVSMQLWFDQAEGTAARALGQASEDLYRTYPQGISSIHWLLKTAALPTGEARQYFAALMDQKSHWFGEVAMVLDGDGFWAGAVRGMLTGLRLAAGSKAGFRVARTIDEGLTWMPPGHLQRTGIPMQPSQIKAAMHQLAAEYG